MSNGSERAPERCPHAPVGPDLAGLRELPTPKPDYEALAGRVRDDYSCTDALHPSLADAVEALLAENTRLRTNMGVMSKLNSTLEDERDLARIERDRTEAERDALRARSKRLRENRMKERAALVARINDYRAERDALRTQLDSMTVEWGTKIVSEPGVDIGTEEYARRNVDRWNASRYHQGDMRGVVVSRLVSPWTVVEGDDQ